MSKKWSEPQSIDGMSQSRHMELLAQQRTMQKRSKFTKKDYMMIGDTIKNLPKKQKEKEYQKWNRIFKKDNPRYKPKIFKSYIGL